MNDALTILMLFLAIVLVGGLMVFVNDAATRIRKGSDDK